MMSSNTSQIQDDSSQCGVENQYQHWLEYTPEDRVWAASIHEFGRQLERQRTDDRTDRLLWTLIQDGLVEEDK